MPFERLTHPLHHAAAAALTALVLLFFASNAASQPAEPPPQQTQLYDQALAAMADERYEAAIALLRRSLRYGQLNIIFLSLGRAHQRNGNCYKAMVAFESALKAPAVANPPPDEVAEVIYRFENELKQECFGTLRVNCSSIDIDLRIDGEGPIGCAQDVSLRPGTYTVIGQLDGRVAEREVVIEGMSTTETSLSIGASTNNNKDSGLSREMIDNLLFFGGGGVSIGIGVALDLIPDSGSNFKVDALDFVPIAFYGIGISAVVYRLLQLLD